MSKTRQLALGLLGALGTLFLQLALTSLFADVAEGSRAQGIGACLATLTMLVPPFVIGAVVRWRHPRPPQTPLELMPWLVPLTSAILLAAAALIAMKSGGDWARDLGSFEPGSLGRAMASTNAIVAPAMLLSAASLVLGINGTGRWYLVGPLGGALVLALSGGGAKIAISVSYDPAVVNAVLITSAIAAHLITGFVMSTATRRLAFIELCIAALSFGYVLYLAMTTVFKDHVAAWNIPKEQVLVVLAFVPSTLSLALLTVGASVGFMLNGAGRFDPRFTFEVGVARRYLRAQARPRDLLLAPIRMITRKRGAAVRGSDNAVGSILVISVAGVSLGVLALVVVLSVMSGFEQDLKSKILGAHAHVVINKRGDDFTEYADVEAQVAKAKGVRTAAAFVLGEGMISSESGLSGTLVKGIDPKNEAAVLWLRDTLTSGSLDFLTNPEKIPGRRPLPFAGTSSTSTTGEINRFVRTSWEAQQKTVSRRKNLAGVVIGRELARTLRVRIGQTVNIVSPTSEEIGPTGPQPKLRRFRVAGIFFSGMYEYDSKFAYVHMTQAQRFFGMRNRATGVELRVDDIDRTPVIVEELKRRVGGYPYAVKDWREMNKELFSALLLEKLAMFIILTFMVLVASFNIVSTLVMIVLEKGREIAILKSMGASEASIMKIFVVQGLIVGVGGALLGLVGGVGICLVLDTFGLPLDADVFYIDRLPVVLRWGEIATIAVAAVVITYLATIYPAMAAAQLRPVEGLRDE